GFQWLLADEKDTSIYAWLRRAPEANPVAVISNFTPVPRQGYRVPLPAVGTWREIINTDATDYGGSGMGNSGAVLAEADSGGAVSAAVTLPPLSTVMLELTTDE